MVQAGVRIHRVQPSEVVLSGAWHNPPGMETGLARHAASRRISHTRHSALGAGRRVAGRQEEEEEEEEEARGISREDRLARAAYGRSWPGPEAVQWRGRLLRGCQARALRRLPKRRRRQRRRQHGRRRRRLQPWLPVRRRAAMCVRPRLRRRPTPTPMRCRRRQCLQVMVPRLGMASRLMRTASSPSCAAAARTRRWHRLRSLRAAAQQPRPRMLWRRTAGTQAGGRHLRGEASSMRRAMRSWGPRRAMSTGRKILQRSRSVGTKKRQLCASSAARECMSRILPSRRPWLPVTPPSGLTAGARPHIPSQGAWDGPRPGSTRRSRPRLARRLNSRPSTLSSGRGANASSIDWKRTKPEWLNTRGARGPTGGGGGGGIHPTSNGGRGQGSLRQGGGRPPRCSPARSCAAGEFAGRIVSTRGGERAGGETGRVAGAPGGGGTSQWHCRT